MDLESFVTAYQESRPRYLGLAFSSPSVPALVKARDRLQRLLAPVDVWRDPDDKVSPMQPISRLQFCDEVFHKRHLDGLIIAFPEEWMIEWPDPERGVFWCRLSETFGVNHIYSLFIETPLNLQHVTRYFTGTHLDDGFTAWISRHGRNI
jgi:hypothetical protein